MLLSCEGHHQQRSVSLKLLRLHTYKVYINLIYNKKYLLKTDFSGQSVKYSTIVIYNSGVLLLAIFYLVRLYLESLVLV